MKNAFDIEIIRSIRQSAGRFVAIVVISLLGAGFYAGLRMAAPDMRLAGDDFFDGCKLYDLSVMTTLGLDKGSLDILEGIEGVGAVMPTYRADAMVVSGSASFAARIESLPVESARQSNTSDGAHAESADENYLNRPLLLEGEWPHSSGECVVGADAAEDLGIGMGDVLVLESGTDELESTFARSEFSVCGLVNSPTYALSSQLGPTVLGAGELDLYLYVPEAAFAKDYPITVAYLSLPKAEEKVWASAAYDDAVRAVRQQVIDVAGEIADERYRTVKDELHAQLLGRMQEMSVSLGWTDDIEWPEVFIMDRSKNMGAASLASDADGISQIALFLPFMFFLVAALVALTSMTRMVDEDRLNIGTHKALGYSSGRITSKYLIFGVLSSGVGSVVGVVVLGKLLPWFIMASYAITYAVPTIPLPIDAGVAARAIGLSVGITALATWGAAVASLREQPARLMLPRTPKAGKRIVLERIGPLWRRFSFSYKVTARNLLRYKRRFFMAVAGIAGCTALLMVGFGLRDAIGSIVANQYEGLVNYDVAVRLDDDANSGEIVKVQDTLDASAVEGYLAVDDFNMVAVGPNDELRIEVIVAPESADFTNYVVLRDRVSGKALVPGDTQIVLTEKAATTLGLEVGDQIVLFEENDAGDATGQGHAFVLGGIAENYLGHYAYLMEDGFRETFGEEPKYDLELVRLNPGVNRDEFKEKLLSLGGVATVSFVADRISTYEDMLDVMNKLIYVIMALSAALAFVVLYNLTNINIAERVREIATLKVLGFTRGEVNAYVFREVIVMSLIGALIGCVVGVPLTFYIARAAETASMMFGRTIEPASFVLSFLITMVFAAIVAFTMRGKLLQVDMVESLKSIE